MADPTTAALRPSAPVTTGGIRQVVGDYVELTKPKVQSLLLLTTVCTMEIAGDPSVGLIALTVVGGYLSAGGAGAVNHYFDRDIDAQMPRTADRPVPSGRVAPRAALIYGIVLAALSFLLLTTTVNLLAASLALSGFLGYVFVYTIWLKRRTPQNIVIGGAAGAIPPLVGWAAVTGELAGMPIYLFAIVFFWTPPHFWALALLMKDEYARVGVPMLPVVKGEHETRKQILLYSVLLWAVTQLPFCAGGLGVFYMVSSVVLGGMFIAGAVVLYRRADRKQRAAAVPVLARLPRAAVRHDGHRRQALESRPHGPETRPQERPLRHRRERRVLLHVRHDVHRRHDLRVVSPLDPPVSPAGEEIHLPGPSLQPLLLAVGITMTLLGATMGLFFLISGLVLTLWTIIRWVADTRRDISALPADHDDH